MASIPDEVIIYFDGASRGNPGLSGAGAVIIINKKIIEELNKFLGKMTNNQAEYCGIQLGLSFLLNNSIFGKKLSIKGDSQLILKQLEGKYKVRSDNLKDLYTQTIILLQTIETQFKTINFNYIPRNLNKKADKLANIAIDTRP